MQLDREPDRHRQRIVFRSTSGLVLTGVVWCVCAAGIVSAVVTGAGVAPVTLLAALGWSVWLAFARPCVVTDAQGVTLRNLVRDVEMPYDCVDDVDTRYALRLHADGRAFSAWAAPAPGGAAGLRDGMRRERAAKPERWRDAPHAVRASGSARAGDAVDTASGAPATVVRRELARRERDGVLRDPAARVRVRVRTDLIAVGAVLLGVAAAAVLLGA